VTKLLVEVQISQPHQELLQMEKKIPTKSHLY